MRADKYPNLRSNGGRCRMMPITEEVRAFLTANAAAQIQRDDEYLDPADGLLHCKTCHGLRQTVIPAPGGTGFLRPRCLCPCQSAAEKQRKAAEENGSLGTSVKNRIRKRGVRARAGLVKALSAYLFGEQGRAGSSSWQAGRRPWKREKAPCSGFLPGGYEHMIFI